jgi:hypothetical protein
MFGAYRAFAQQSRYPGMDRRGLAIRNGDPAIRVLHFTCLGTAGAEPAIPCSSSRVGVRRNRNVSGAAHFAVASNAVDPPAVENEKKVTQFVSEKSCVPFSLLATRMPSSLNAIPQG